MSLTFYYAPMTSATRVHWALEELEIPYEKIRLDLQAGDQKKAEYTKLNPNAKVPLLVVGDDPREPIFESLAQLLYLGETYGVEKGLFPAPGIERAKCFKWMAWASVTLYDAIHRMIRNSERFPEDQRSPKAKEVALADLHNLFGMLETHLQGKSWVYGNSFSFADIALATFLPFASKLGIDTARYERIQEWVGRCITRPAMGRAMTG
jgi:glutathione S-transferase